MSHLDRILDAETNPELTMAQTSAPASSEVFQRPPEVNTLRQWGQFLLPEGKHKGERYEEAFKDQNYVFQLRNRKAVSQWVKGFRMYSRIRVQADYQQAMQLQAKGIPVTIEMINQMEIKPRAYVNTNSVGANVVNMHIDRRREQSMGQSRRGEDSKDRDHQEAIPEIIAERSSQSSDVNRAKCRKGSAVEGSDCPASKRIGPGDTNFQRCRG